MRVSFLCAFAAAALVGCTSAPTVLPVPEHAVIGVTEAQLTADYWIKRAVRPDRLTRDRAQIASQNAKLLSDDKSMHDLQRLPATLTAADVRREIEERSRRPSATVYDVHGQAVSAATLDELVNALALEAIPASQATRHGMVVKRADLRTFPTQLRVFRSKGDTDIDRFQESALFPGAPVVIVHTSRDAQWLFVLSEFYAAWIERAAVAEGAKDDIFGYGSKSPFLVVTGATAKTVFTPEAPAVSELQLDMGVRVPVLADWPANKAVNGQHPYAAHIIALPIRNADGSLSFAPALLPKTADVASDYLPLNDANVVRQGFKFLGERYGWGHSYNARDCSGFVSEVYRSFDVRMPRNTHDQGVSPAFTRIELTTADSHPRRLEILRTLQIGDLVYIPRHVMMVIGHERGVPYVIHDTTGIAYRHHDQLVRVPLNGVSVTPLTPLLIGAGTPMIDSIYSIVQFRR
jgi:cell wall-associated NlpC family hydrolase